MSCQDFLPVDSFSIVAEKAIGTKNAVRIGTIGDGSCFFHSLCMALNRESYAKESSKKRKEIVRQLRTLLEANVTEEALKHISEKSNAEVGTLEAFKKKLLDCSVWADEPMIRWTAEYLNINIIFLNIVKNAFFCNVHHPLINKSLHCESGTCGGPKNTVVVAWVQHQHFELIGIAQKSPDVAHLSVKVLFLSTEHVIKEILERYTSQCKLKL